ncbi:UDP-N-acetylmuramate--L-alanine ligase [Phaeovibrio sulfidiphilus]|uniref:UDP-N-acetylmuramate--L-alanine ligase n=1 Tax=Phaeovibrio sulfidiphilus TaxID=1220600 RepID=A0A8J7CD71_9PROT|nr:UDP-N-acetylmuramate--L-alanine ligase [Phaeovibrio sulfidiphilus]MBE1237518.1 UDP-N-acetylmuramate--L-alanine ligase [Phaeovibrio sulfidiphilus]
MRTIPLDIGPIHFVGIGGIGMSGIAEVLVTLGYRVQGSDLSENANVQRLRSLGVEIAIGHDRENLGEAAVVVISSAVKPTNPEVLEARARFVPVVRRAEMLSELMRLKASIAVAGTHGKTTSTSLVAQLLETANMDPTVINGGILNARGTNAYLGSGEWMVVEADESDGTFIKLPATVAMITNIDPEHMDHYADFDTLRDAFRTFIQNLPFYGFASVCLDHPEVQSLIATIQDRRLVTYGFNPQADVQGTNVEIGPDGARFSVIVHNRKTGEERLIPDIALPMYGQHNVLNALGALAIGLELGIPDATLKEGFARFRGVKRRFTLTGEVDGIKIIDDYGHHPVEIAAVLKAAREATRREVVAVVQPHRYTRLQTLFEDFCTAFNDANTVLVADVYSAGETPIPGVDADALVEGLRDHGHRGAEKLESEAALAERIADLAQSGDMVVFLGAGSITNWAQALPRQLAEVIARRGAGQAPAERSGP